MSDASKLEDLEIRLAHFERMVDDLSDVAARQAREIERLKARLDEADRTLGDVADALDRAGTPVHQKPPHY
ncbi:MAG: SlyX family protein [Marivibrio sp.]|uniref:SlyX family protein n=1 Tax=Marivibrio sp. TaxID=2039719 RepID=UPI0032EE4004